MVVPFPLGYKRNPGRPGFLEIDKKEAEAVKAAFDYFLKYETLSRAAKELNKDGISCFKTQEGRRKKLQTGIFYGGYSAQRYSSARPILGLGTISTGTRELTLRRFGNRLLMPKNLREYRKCLKKIIVVKSLFPTRRPFPYILTGIAFLVKRAAIPCVGGVPTGDV